MKNEDLVKRLEARMLDGTEFTYMGLYMEFTTDRDADRVVDRTIQRLRKQGKIVLRRDGRYMIWKVAT